MSILNELKQQYQFGGAITQIIFWNVILFALPLVLQSVLMMFGIHWEYAQWISLSSSPTELLYKPWSIFTYAFFHFDFLHLIFNMITLHFIGVIFHVFFTQKQLVGLYILGILFSGLIYILSFFVFPILESRVVPLIGASGAIMAIIFASASYSPHTPVRLLLIGNVKLWHIAMVFLILDIIQLPYQNTGGHLAHLGGALFGYLYIVLLKSGTDLSKFWSYLTAEGAKLFQPQKNKKFTVHRNTTPPDFNKNRIIKTKTQQQIDEILDKISKSGYDSLSKEEKDFLFKAGK